MQEIDLTKSKVAIVDDEDYALVSKYSWYAHLRNNVWYACTRNKAPGKLSIMMHNLIFPMPKGSYPDHINHNGLDNRKSNLRQCNVAQNLANRRKRNTASPNTSRFKGSSLVKTNGTWRARIGYMDEDICLGTFKTEEEAARAYDEAAKKYFGEFACLNFPEKLMRAI